MFLVKKTAARLAVVFAASGTAAFACHSVHAHPLPNLPEYAGETRSSRTIHLEAENARLEGPQVSTARSGFSGAGYVTGLQNQSDRIVWSIPKVKAGIYEVRIRYSSPFGEKGYELVINGAKTSGMFAPASGFTTHVAGKAQLKNGANTVAIEKGWGWYDIDAIDFVPVTVAALRKPPKTLVDSRATAKTRALMSYLVNLYGKKTLSGQYEHRDTDYIRSLTGKTPAVLGGDFMEYSPSRLAHGAKPGNYTERLLQSARNGQIITLSWHWNAPSGLYNKNYTDSRGRRVEALWWRGFYTNATSFDVQKALANPRSAEYRLLLRDIDAIAGELKKFAAADIPVLWRPLHEAEGKWFWWGAKGPTPFVQLWRLMFDRLKNHHGLHNLIWVYTGTADRNWYPGHAYVDIVGVDTYPSDPGDTLSNSWEQLAKRYGGRKLLAISEFGGVPDVEKMRQYGVQWSYFVSWGGTVRSAKMPKEEQARIYRSTSVITRDELVSTGARSRTVRRR